MAANNSARFIGRFASDPDVKEIKGGKTLCNFKLAVQRPFSKNEADFFPCTAWENQAATIGKYFKKGDMIAVEGYLQNNKYKAKDGADRISTELRVDSFAFVGKNGGSGNNGAGDDDDLPLD